MGPDSIGYNVQGLTLLETSGASGTYLFSCYGSGCHFKDVHLEKNPPASGYIGYCEPNTSNNVFENISFAGSNGIYIGGHDHQIIGGWGDSFGGDDCWALKAAASPCYNIHISGFRARGFGSLVSIGSEVGSQGVDDPEHKMFVKNVVVENCSAEECTYLAYIKPGAIQAYDYRDGLVEDVSIFNCQLADSSGRRFRNGVYVSPGNGAIVRGLTVNNLTITARGASPAVQTVSALYLYVLGGTNGAGVGGSIENVSVSGLRSTDPFGGAATGGSAPGTPIHSLMSIEKLNPNIGRIGQVEVIDASSDGCARMAVQVGPQVNGPISVGGCTFNNYAAAIYGTADKGSVLALSPIQLTNIAASPSPNAPSDTRGVLPDANPDKTVQYFGDLSPCSLETVAPGTPVTAPIYSAARDSWISMVEITVGQTIPQDDNNWVQFAIRNGGNGQVLAAASTKTNGLPLTAGTPVSINGAVQFSGSTAYLPKGAQLIVEISHGGQGAPVVDPTFMVHSVPYGIA
jgi:hypothetical protein